MTKLKKNVLYNLGGQVSLLVLGFLAVKFIYGRLGEDALGIIYFSATAGYVLSLVFEMGICATSTREVAANMNHDPQYVHNLIQTGSMLYWGGFLVLSVLSYFLAPLLSGEWVIVESIDRQTATTVFRILGISALLSLPKAFYSSLIKGLERMEFDNIIAVVTSGMRQLGTIAIIMLGGNLFHVIYWFSFSYLIEVVSYIVVLNHFFPVNAFIPKVHSDVIIRNYSFASNMTLVTIFWAIQKQADKVVLSKFMPIAIFGYYSVTQRMVTFGSMMAQAIKAASYPSFAALVNNKNRKEVLEQYYNLQEIVAYGSVPILAFIPFALLPALSFVFKPDIAHMVLFPATILCLRSYLDGNLRIPINIALAMDRPEIVKRTNLYSILFVVPLSIPLISYFGLTGAALGGLLRVLFFYFFAIPKICTECLHIKVKAWFWHVGKILFVVGLTYGFSWMIISNLRSYTIPSLALAYLLSTVIFTSLSLTLINVKLREKCGDLLRLFRLRSIRVMYQNHIRHSNST